jgi:phosphoribosyl-AMP cyclohydrolase / phosphoribosyl-ATP pyrophosphohydrolase
MEINFDKNNGLIPAVIQDTETQKVLMVGFMNEESYNITLREKKVTFYSRTRQKIWTKGETSGNFLHVVDILKDCDNDTILVKARPEGPVCHTGNDTCFNEINKPDFLTQLGVILKKRKNHPEENSYTSSLFQKGINKIAQKVGEEAVELIIEAKDNNDELFLNEAADLLFHYMMLLTEKGFNLHEVVSILEERNKKKN